MKNIKIVFVFIVTLLFVSSCVKDNSNTEFASLNNIKIEGIDARYEVNLDQKLQINPIITADSDDLSYVWYLYSARSESKRDTLSLEKNLDYVITAKNAIPGEEYKLIFRAIDNKTGVFSRKEIGFRANSLYSNGLLMLCKNGAKTELNMLMSDNKTIAEINTGEVLTNHYHQVAFANPNPITVAMKQVYLFANQEDGGMILDPVSLSKVYSVRDMFDDGITEPALNVRDYSGKLGMIEYLSVNGNLCKRATNMNVLRFQASPLVVSGSASNYRIGGYIYCGADPILYEEISGRILVHSPFNKGVLMRANPALSQKNPFDPDNMGNYKYLSAARESVGIYWLLLRENTTNDLVLFRFKKEGTAAQIAITPLSKTIISSTIAPNMLTANHFVINNRETSTNCMYVSNNVLYSLNTTMVGNGAEQLAEIELARPTDVTITGVEYLLATVPDPTPEKPAQTRVSQQVRLLVQDNTLTSKKGGILYYEITTTGGLKATEYFRKVGGFCDQIIDIDEKNS